MSIEERAERLANTVPDAKVGGLIRHAYIKGARDIQKSVEERARFVADLIPDKDIGGLIYQAYKEGAAYQQKVIEDRACESFRNFLVFIKREEWQTDIEEVVNDFRNVILREE